VREDERSIVCFIGIGSNVADSVSNCLESIERISLFSHIRITKKSSLYRTEPVGLKEQEWFVNGVIEIKTKYTATTLLKVLQQIEKDMGRIREERWGPRTIDLDILFYGQEVIKEKDISVPHPELHKRRFVLIPMYEIAPYVIHPAFGISIKGLLSRLQDESRVEVLFENSNVED